MLLLFLNCQRDPTLHQLVNGRVSTCCGYADLRASCSRVHRFVVGLALFLGHHNPQRTPTGGGDLLSGGDAVSGGDVVIGRADLPGRQEQPPELLRIGADRGLAVLGAPGTGRTAVLRALASQVPGALHVPEDPEGAWDVVTGLADGRRECPPLVLCDEIDAQVGELPGEYGQYLIQAWERLLRGATRTTFVLTATRAGGAVGRLLDALPRRALLRMPSRVEHLAAGGESGGYDRERPAGRATIGDHEVQFAWVPAHEGRTARPSETPQWTPASGVTAIVTPGPHSVARRLAEAFPGCSVALAPNAPDEPTRPVLLVADAETWQRNWSLWQHARSEGEVLIRAENPGDLRQLAGVRDLPPYARPHAGRAWVLGGAEPPRRVALTAWETR